jgi:hypothetical protein
VSSLRTHVDGIHTETKAAIAEVFVEVKSDSDGYRAEIAALSAKTESHFDALMREMQKGREAKFRPRSVCSDQEELPAAKR